MKMLLPAMSEAHLQRLRSSAPALEYLVAANAREALALAPQVHASFTFFHPDLISAAPHLRWVQTRSAGVDSCPFDQFRARQITLTNARDIYGIQLADHTLALILAFSRQLPFLFRAQQREEWMSRDTFPPGELAGQTLLVVGLGGTGLETARRAAGFGLRVLATRRRTSEPKPAFVDALHPPEDLHRLLPEADWVAVCVPLTRHTRDLFSDREFLLMKPSAHIVCVTRGGIINTAALLRALEQGRIAGAGLDVTDPEPLPAGHPLWSRPEVILTPHASGHSPHADARMFDLLCENTRRFAQGETLLNIVDLDMEY
ncbi:MAG: D-2-hydroxyacid dehydrogenase [Candidatus Latescibacteria bacterium]|nr:D-2-hydroxyacid dehydrogenase [Candidatus Latescibacterota bacterium]